MQERRQAYRLEPDISLPVFNQLRRRRVGELRDISTGGFQLLSEVRLPMEQEFLFWVKLPSGIGQRTWTALQARVVWRRRDSEGNFFCHGLKIHDSSRIPLCRILEELHLAHPPNSPET